VWQAWEKGVALAARSSAHKIHSAPSNKYDTDRWNRRVASLWDILAAHVTQRVCARNQQLLRDLAFGEQLLANEESILQELDVAGAAEVAIDAAEEQLKQCRANIAEAAAAMTRPCTCHAEYQ
jgi:hypothetical protein